jgi:hypothetical protein
MHLHGGHIADSGITAGSDFIHAAACGICLFTIVEAL